MKIYYLNNSGHRWVIFDETGRREKRRAFETKSHKNHVVLMLPENFSPFQAG
jgi:hypothetical protein